jgi:hypothetical protein
MFGRNDIADKALLKSVQRRLERTGSKTRLNATMRQGTVTLTGQLQYEKQRLQIVNAVKGVSGVRQVIDQLVSPPKAKPQPAHYGSGPVLPRQPEVSDLPIDDPTVIDDEEVIVEVAAESVGDGPQDEVA